MDVRGRLIERLATPQMEARFAEPYFPRESVQELGCRPHEFWEAIWGLVADGLVYLDPAGQERASTWDNWRWRLSARGIQAATGGSWEPRDPERYLDRLTTRCPELDTAAVAYVREALHAFNARCYLASSVMLGVAAEQVFGRLASAFARAYETDAASLSKLLGNPSTTYYKRFQEFRKRLEPRRGDLPDGLADNLTLDAVADLLRITRNNAGHPSGRTVDEDTAYTHLQMAARFLTKMTELAAHFEATDG
ncbi:MAG TPA: hypothetical protein VF587_13420 [Solirubrobacteraceae bacterium]|jgi:hypothetical protein